MEDQKGFSLVELLVVVIIIGIIAAIAIPSLLASRRAAVETAAAAALRVITVAEKTYQATVGGQSNYGHLSELSLAANGGLIDAVLASGNKGTYAFTMPTPAAGTPGPNFCVTATPNASSTGIRIFAVSDDGVIRVSDDDGTNAPTCTAGVATGGNVFGG